MNKKESMILKLLTWSIVPVIVVRQQGVVARIAELQPVDCVNGLGSVRLLLITLFYLSVLSELYVEIVVVFSLYFYNYSKITVKIITLKCIILQACQSLLFYWVLCLFTSKISKICKNLRICQLLNLTEYCQVNYQLTSLVSQKVPVCRNPIIRLTRRITKPTRDR